MRLDLSVVRALDITQYGLEAVDSKTPELGSLSAAADTTILQNLRAQNACMRRCRRNRAHNGGT